MFWLESKWIRVRNKNPTFNAIWQWFLVINHLAGAIVTARSWSTRVNGSSFPQDMHAATSLLIPGWAEQLRGLGHSHGTGGDGQHTCWEHKQQRNGNHAKSAQRAEQSLRIEKSHFLAQKAVQSLPTLSLHAVLYNTWKKITVNRRVFWTETIQNQVLLWRLTYQEHQTVQEQGVEKSNSPRHLVGENRTTLRDTKRKVRHKVRVDSANSGIWVGDIQDSELLYPRGWGSGNGAGAPVKTHQLSAPRTLHSCSSI